MTEMAELAMESAYEFSPFQLDRMERSPLRDGEVAPLKPNVFDTPPALVESHGDVVSWATGQV
jgi:DNA-binding winged helix-turn-helix (wHTH) protein